MLQLEVRSHTALSALYDTKALLFLVARFLNQCSKCLSVSVVIASTSVLCQDTILTSPVDPSYSAMVRSNVINNFLKTKQEIIREHSASSMKPLRKRNQELEDKGAIELPASLQPVVQPLLTRMDDVKTKMNQNEAVVRPAVENLSDNQLAVGSASQTFSYSRRQRTTTTEAKTCLLRRPFAPGCHRSDWRSQHHWQVEGVFGILEGRNPTTMVEIFCHWVPFWNNQRHCVWQWDVCTVCEGHRGIQSWFEVREWEGFKCWRNPTTGWKLYHNVITEPWKSVSLNHENLCSTITEICVPLSRVFVIQNWDFLDNSFLAVFYFKLWQMRRLGDLIQAVALLGF